MISSTAVVPAVGADPQACAEGDCAISVTVGVTIEFGIGPLTISAGDAAGVTLVGPHADVEVSRNKGCSTGITTPGICGPGRVELSCAAGARAVVNGMDLSIADIANESAVLHIRPAPQ